MFELPGFGEEHDILYICAVAANLVNLKPLPISTKILRDERGSYAASFKDGSDKPSIITRRTYDDNYAALFPVDGNNTIINYNVFEKMTPELVNEIKKQIELGK